MECLRPKLLDQYEYAQYVMILKESSFHSITNATQVFLAKMLPAINQESSQKVKSLKFSLVRSAFFLSGIVGIIESLVRSIFAILASPLLLLNSDDLRRNIKLIGHTGAISSLTWTPNAFISAFTNFENFDLSNQLSSSIPAFADLGEWAIANSTQNYIQSQRVQNRNQGGLLWINHILLNQKEKDDLRKKINH